MLEKNGIMEGYIVGGIADSGFSENDADIITSKNLEPPFHTIKDSTEPQGKSIDISKLAKVRVFVTRLKIMKPSKTKSVSQEYYDLNDFKDFKGNYAVEPKWDGYRVTASKIGHGILIRTDEGRSIEDKLPNVAEELRNIPFDTAVLDCELVVYIRGRRGDHTDVAVYLNSASPAEDYHIKLKPFDILYADGVDIRAEPLKSRKETLAKVAWTEHVHPVKFIVANGDNLIATIKEQATDEGAMVKDMESTYDPSGKGWWKWKRQFEIDARVTAVKKVTSGYVYVCEAGGGEIGTTYATDIKAKVGSIITVSVDHITKREGGRFSWYAPKVTALREDKTEPDTAAVLEKMVAMKTVETNAADNSAERLPVQKPVLEGDFVLHEHWWGEKHHFDLRFRKMNSEGKAVMIGFTLFADSEEELKTRMKEGGKLLAKEKEYHAPEWLTFEGEIKPGDAGNPTKNLIAHMKLRDKGHYSFSKRQSDFVDMTLDGNILNGRYYVRKVALTNNATEDPNSGPKPKEKQPEGQAAISETTKSKDNSWLFWKAKDNTKVDSADSSMPVLFTDSTELNTDASKLIDTKDGLLVKDAVLCRAMVLDYQGRKILKPPAVLKESMSTMQRMVIVDNHPTARLITDISEVKGRVIPESIRIEKNAAIGNLLITDTILAEKVKKGKRDLSPGYFADINDESGTFEGETYTGTQANILYDHLAIVDRGRCPLPRCGIVDTANTINTEIIMDEIGIPKEITDGIEKDLGEMHEMAAKLSPDERAQVGRFIEGMNSHLLMIHRMDELLKGMPEEMRNTMSGIVKNITRSLAAAQGAGDNPAGGTKMMGITAVNSADTTTSTQPKTSTDSQSSINDVHTETKTQMESIIVDSVTYTPDSIKKLVADSAALSEAQRIATDTKKLLDAKEAEVTETKKVTDVSIAALQTKLDEAEKERRAPYIKQITDSIPALTIDDLKSWDFKRLVDTAANLMDSKKLSIKGDAGKPTKSLIDDAYAKVK